MISMILFGLKRKLWNRRFLLKIVFMFICVGIVIYLDTIFSLFVNTKIEIAIDPSVGEYSEYLKDTDRITFIDKADIRLVFDDGWKLYSDEIIMGDVVDEVYQVLDAIEGYHGVSRDYEIEVHSSRIMDYSMELVIFTCIYFLFISKSISIVQEIVEDKVCGMLKLYLTSMQSHVYVLCKIVESWLQVVFENLLLVLSIVVWLCIRFGVYIENGFRQWFALWIDMDGSMIRFEVVVIGLVFLLVGLFVMQYCILWYMASAKTIEEANHMTVWIHVLPILIYYCSYSLYSFGLLNCSVYIPFLQTLLLPMSLSYMGKITPNIAINMVFCIVFGVVLVSGSRKYIQRRLLNIEKVTKLF